MEPTFEQTIHNKTMDLDLTSAGQTNVSLNTLCADLFLIIFNISPTLDMGSEKDMRRLIKHFIDRFDANCKSVGIKTEKKDLAKYSLISLIDEKVIALPKKWSEPWSSQPLQFDYFQKIIAGERFFENLDTMMKDVGEYADVIEVYYLCLCLGFKGKYSNDKSSIDELIKNVARTLVKHRPQVAMPPPPSGAERRERRTVPLIPTWAIVSSTAAIVILLWIGAWAMVSRQSRSLLPLSKPAVEESVR
jgi:type VI secretion system protein ImpK